jgi:hypothetical protein
MTSNIDVQGGEVERIISESSPLGDADNYHKDSENANFCTSDPTLHSVLPSVVLVSPLGGASVADDGKYLTPKGNLSDM